MPLPLCLSHSASLPLPLCLFHFAAPTLRLPLYPLGSASPALPHTPLAFSLLSFLSPSFFSLTFLSLRLSPPLPLSHSLFPLSKRVKWSSKKLPHKTPPPIPHYGWPLALRPQVTLVYSIQHKTHVSCSWSLSTSTRRSSVVFQIWNDGLYSVNINIVFLTDDSTPQFNFLTDKSTLSV